jgi:hypothetical protein
MRAVLKAAPQARDSALANRAFLGRAVRFLVGEAGIRQIIDIGTGIPATGNVHEVAGQVDPQTQVVDVDNGPIVHVHANALLGGSGTTGIVLADLREPEATLRSRAQVAGFFDGWDLAEPGLVQVPLWRPDGKPPGPGELARAWVYGGVGRKNR